MQIFDFRDYKAYLTDLIATFPKKGRGQAQKLAKHLGVNPVIISQVLKADRDFTIEQALPVAQFFGLNEKSADYFVLMVSKARAGTKALADHYESKLRTIRDAEKTILSKYAAAVELNDTQKAIFYSDWIYSAVRLLSSIDGYNDVASIAKYFEISHERANRIMQFLLETGLCKEVDGKISMGPAKSFINSDSPFVQNHRRNWRIRALQKMTSPAADDMFFSASYSLSREDFEVIKRTILELIQKTSATVKESPSERLACMTIDFFGV